MTIRELLTLMPSQAVEDGELCAYALLGMSLLVCRLEGEVRVFENRCPVDGASLDSGRLAGAILHCPKHQGSWDLRSGRPVTGQDNQALRRFDVFEHDGSIQIVTG